MLIVRSNCGGNPGCHEMSDPLLSLWLLALSLWLLSLLLLADIRLGVWGWGKQMRTCEETRARVANGSGV